MSELREGLDGRQSLKGQRIGITEAAPKKQKP